MAEKNAASYHIVLDECLPTNFPHLARSSRCPLKFQHNYSVLELVLSGQPRNFASAACGIGGHNSSSLISIWYSAY